MRKLGVVFSLLLLGGVLTVAVLGVPDASYAPSTSDRYLWGAAHVHSELSDGRASLEDIAEAAARAHVDFVLLADHGPPNRDAALIDETIGGVRFIGGSEVELPEGHLIVSDVDTLTRFKLPPYPPDAIADAREWGGFTVVAHPQDGARPWSYWEDDFLPGGIEILNVTSQFRDYAAIEKLRSAWFFLFGSYELVGFMTAPAGALDRWDELLERGPVWSFYATNAHGGLPWSVSSPEAALPFPSYETVFSYVALGVDREYEDDPMRAVRRGDFFSVIRAAGEPEHFTFRAGEDLPAGSFAPADTRLRVELDARDLSPRIVLKRAGETVSDTTESKLELEASAGVYRVEVYLDDHPVLANDVPWILSNPIFVAKSYPPVAVDELTCTSIEPFASDELRVEKDRESEGVIERTEDGGLKLWYRLSRATPENPDRWVAFALRKPLDFSDYRGILLEADAARPTRLWIELRAGERSHYASIELDQGPNRVTIPWDRFYAFGEGREPPVLGQLDALFLTVNTSNSYTGFRRAFTVTAFGGCL